MDSRDSSEKAEGAQSTPLFTLGATLAWRTWKRIINGRARPGVLLCVWKGILMDGRVYVRATSLVGVALLGFVLM